MLNIKYITDSASDIPKDLAEKYDVAVLATPITFEDGTTKRDWYDMTPAEFYDLLEKSTEIPTTSQPPVFEIEETFRKYLDSHDAIIYVSLSSFSSGTYNAANMAKNNILEDRPDAKIEIIDSRAFSLFEVFMLEEAIKLQNEGKSLEEIVEGVKMRRRMTDVCVVVDTLKYLEKGGRINKASLVVGTLLDLKPVLSVRGGTMESIDKFRGSKSVYSKMVKKVKTMDVDLSDPRFSIVESNVPERAEALKEALKEGFENYQFNYHSSIGGTVGTHIGPGTLAVFFKTNTPQKVYDED